MNRIRCLLALIAILSYPCANVQAHKVTVFAWVEGDTVHTESKFSGGRKVKSGTIEVYDHREEKVVNGTTDENGYYAFSVPKTAESLRVVLVAGEGHSNSWNITGEELGLKATAPAPTSAPLEAVSADRRPQIDTQALEAVVDRALERKLAPIRAQLAEQAWGLRDIVAGLGYILGLMGVASYVHHRKAKDTADH